MIRNIYLVRLRELRHAADLGCAECADRLAKDGRDLVDLAIRAGAAEEDADLHPVAAAPARGSP